MLYACAFRAYYFIKARRARAGESRTGRRKYLHKPFNTLQLRLFDKRIKTGIDRGGGSSQRSALKYDSNMRKKSIKVRNCE